MLKILQQTAKASRKQSSLSGKESAQGCIPTRLPGRPDEALGEARPGQSSLSAGALRYRAWATARHAPLSLGFPWQEYWSRLPCSPPGDLPDLGIKPASLIFLHSLALPFLGIGMKTDIFQSCGHC